MTITNYLVQQRTRSCGCLQRESVIARNYRHGGKMRVGPTREHISWRAAHQRCFYPKDKFYPKYGGAGITMCDRWRNSFAAFLEDMGPCPDGHTLDRIDSAGNYEPSNCRWASAFEQNHNRRNSRLLTYEGETKPLSEWGAQFNIPYPVLLMRIRRGWPVERALTTPSRGIGKGQHCPTCQCHIAAVAEDFAI